MNIVSLRHLTHGPLKLIPWYVNCTLDEKESRRVAAHVRTCPMCQREVDDLAKIFSARARTLGAHPVDESQLDALLTRIENYESQQRRVAQEPPAGSSNSLSTMLFGWLPSRPALVAAASAALVLGIVTVPLLRQPAVAPAYRVLGSDEPANDQLRLRLQLQTDAAPDVVRRLVDASTAQYGLAGEYRVESHQNGEYVVIFAKKPPVDAMSRLLESLRAAPDVVGVAIDGE
jgi:anti-sigma factor RsiW